MAYKIHRKHKKILTFFFCCDTLLKEIEQVFRMERRFCPYGAYNEVGEGTRSVGHACIEKQLTDEMRVSSVFLVTVMQ